METKLYQFLKSFGFNSSSSNHESVEEPLSRRLWEIDSLRGIAILMMVTYHLLWDLQELAGFPVNVYEGFWFYFQVCTASLFLLVVGISLSQSYKRDKGKETGGNLWQKYIFRGLRIYVWGLVITVATYFFDPYAFVRFGILHLIGFSIMVSYPFLRFRWANLFFGIAVILLRQYIYYLNLDVSWLNWLGLDATPRAAIDFFSVLPWFGMVLIGIFIGNTLYFNTIDKVHLPDLSQFLTVRILVSLGRKSLTIYLVHQPIIISFLVLTGVIDAQFWL